MKLTTSVVTGRTQQVLYRGCLSAVQPVQYGVPQGSVLGLILFLLYTAEIGRIVAQHGLRFHQYADNCQFYVTTSVSAVHNTIDQLSRCLHDVDVWMSASRLCLNASKTSVCGLAPGITSTDSLFMTYQSCRSLSASSAQRATSALSLTASCQWPTTWR